MHLIIYTSEFAGTADDISTVLPDIIYDLKTRNQELGITGTFFHHNLRFIMVLEGETDELEDIISVLENDERHRNLQRIVDQGIKKRGFRKWDIDSLNLNEDRKIDPEELKSIRDSYTRHLLIDSRILVDFFKAMLALHSSNREREYRLGV